MRERVGGRHGAQRMHAEAVHFGADAGIRARPNAGLTQQQLAQRLKTHQGNIARLERNRTHATVRTLQRIATATGHRLVIDFRE